jgi:hypothetical protein
MRRTRGDTHKRPPWASAIDQQTASPIPRPSDFVVKKGWNMRSATAGSSPVPVSLIATSTQPGSASVEDIVSSLMSAVTPFIASMRFMIRFKITAAVERDRPGPAARPKPARYATRHCAREVDRDAIVWALESDQLARYAGDL